MEQIKKKFKKVQLALAFAFIVFLIILITILVMFLCIFILNNLGFQIIEKESKVKLLLLGFFSLPVGTVAAFLFSKKTLQPIRTLGEAADKIASGDFSARVELKGPDEIVQLGRQFNHMAEELSSVEILRTDFINNFSHELKTPIVSIHGFAKILKRSDLSDEERIEYLDTIIAESERLTELATNTLNLTKLEKQTLLTNRTTFNLSEQIRRVIAIMYSKWGKKDIQFNFDCRERFITGNAELLDQVWVNLLDNAAKFSTEHSSVEVSIKECSASNSNRPFYLIYISDHGIGMDEETAAHIFDKFYQGDTSHTGNGNGLGLTIAKRIIELHDGTINVKSDKNAGTVFEIGLPL